MTETSRPTNVSSSGPFAHTVLGPVPVRELGVVLARESLLSIVPGAEFASEVNIEPGRIFEQLRDVLTEFRRAGGGTIVDCGGLFQGRDPVLYGLLSKTTGVHIVASTGLGPEKMVGWYFRNPYAVINPPREFTVEEIASLFAREVTEGMVVPRIERRGPAGVVCTAASHTGITQFETKLYRASAHAALDTGVPVSLAWGSDPLAEIELLLQEGLPANRVLVSGLDTSEALERGWAKALARRGVMVGLDHVGASPHEGWMSEMQRVRHVLQLFEAGLGEQIVVSSQSVGCAYGYTPPRTGFGHVLDIFVPLLLRSGGSDDHVRSLLEDNPQRFLSVTTGRSSRT